MRKELLVLREEMQKQGIDAYLIPTSDFHGSEYLNEYFKCRQYISGFTGSAGTLLVTAKEAFLWTDGRYFLQAATQLEGSGIELCKMGEPNVPTILEQLTTSLPENGTLGFDGRILNSSEGITYANKLQEKNIRFLDIDLMETVWQSRPAIVPSKIFALSEAQSEQTTIEKLNLLREDLKNASAFSCLITNLEEISWILNMRGNDISHTPVFFAYMLLDANTTKVYAYKEAFCEETLELLNQANITLLPYTQIYDDIKCLDKDTICLIDEASINYALLKSFPNDVKLINQTSPAKLRKSIKNQAEINCLYSSHQKDGVAMVKFLYWLKKNIKEQNISELSASDYLETCRSSQKGFLDLSFSTIAGYAEHGAIVHYSATKESNSQLKPEGFLLVDSGGQYTDGTTDITRTIALGPVSDEMKLHYTTVLKSNLDLSMALFLKGCRGVNLDILAREPLWKLCLDYNHGTGHGVGFLLSVHEGPNSFRWKITESTPLSSEIVPGMITTDEPGLYLEGRYGIRLENELLCVSHKETQYGTFLGFEPLTLCPFDPDAIDVSLLTQEEIAYLNQYHQMVYDKISPDLNLEEQLWLLEQTRPL